MAAFIDRMVRAAKLEPGLYAEVENDAGAMKQALGVVLVSSAAAGLGSTLFLGPVGLIGGAVSALVMWFVWAVLSHFVGTTLLAEPATKADLSQVMRVTGFAAAPGVLRIFGGIPLLGGLINLVAMLWMLAAFVVAIRQVLDYTSTGRALAVAAVGFVVQIIVIFLFALIGLGGIALMTGS
jgi:hypothetical protein